MPSRAIALTRERLHQVLDYNPELGEFRWKVDHCEKSSRKGERAGSTYSNGYRIITIDGARYSEHRLAFLAVTGAWPTDLVDHVNGAKDDNRWSNLRPANHLQNTVNRPSHNPLGRGVRLNRSGTYRATITVSRRKISLGSYQTPEEAHAVFMSAARELHGEFARAK